RPILDVCRSFGKSVSARTVELLTLLGSSPHRATEALLVRAYGFTSNMTTDLLSRNAKSLTLAPSRSGPFASGSLPLDRRRSRRDRNIDIIQPEKTPPRRSRWALRKHDHAAFRNRACIVAEHNCRC